MNVALMSTIVLAIERSRAEGIRLAVAGAGAAGIATGNDGGGEDQRDDGSLEPRRDDAVIGGLKTTVHGEDSAEQSVGVEPLLDPAVTSWSS